MIVWRDGDFLSSGAAVSAADRGYLVGDGIFETMLVRNGKPAFLAAHLARLARGADALAMSAPIDGRSVQGAIAGLAARLGLEGEAVCRLTMTRVGGERGLAPSPGAPVQTMISLRQAPPPKPVLRFVQARTRRYAAAETNAFKCIGAYAPNVLARLEAARAGADEAIMLNERGGVACASAANVFVLSGDLVLTPAEEDGATPGTTRALLIEAAAETGIVLRAQSIDPGLLVSNPVLLSNSLIGARQASAPGAGAHDNPVFSKLIGA